ncbi:Protein SAR DEFICIENT 1, partial [Zea mays]
VVRGFVDQESIQQIFHYLEPLISRVVREEIQNIFSHCHNDHMPIRSLPLRIREAHVLPHLKLVFAKQLKQPIFTNNKIVDIANNPIEIHLMDTTTNSMIPSRYSPWTIISMVLKAREGKRPLLVGSLNVPMNNHGVAVIDDVFFTDNSSWIRCRKFRIGVRIMPADHLGSRVKEAVSESFTVRDHRGESYKKHYPPLMTDNIWRLKNIGKDGPIDKRLQSEGIRNVQDFLKLNTIDPEKLQALVGMSDKQWNTTLNHAKTCDMGRKCYTFKTVGCDITFNPIGEVLRARDWRPYISSARTAPISTGNFHVKQLAAQAYQMWDQLEEVPNEKLFAANKSFVPRSSSDQERTESQAESMISSGSQNTKYLDYTGTATSGAAAMPNSCSTSDSIGAAPADDAMLWRPSIPPECNFSWQDSAACWD